MRAIILAGGKGTRLKPYTTFIPKPLVPIGGEMSILEIVLRQLAQSGFTHVTLAVNHLSNLIMAYFGDGSRWGITIDYSLESKPLSTIGPITLIPDLPENFLVMNGDILCDLDYRAFYDFHVTSGSDVTVSSYKRDTKIDFGVLRYDSNGFIREFIEKPVHHYDVSMGIYGVRRSLIEGLAKNEPYGFDDLMLDGIKNGHRMIALPFAGFWLDIGRPDDYDYANEHYDEIKNLLGLK